MFDCFRGGGGGDNLSQSSRHSSSGTGPGYHVITNGHSGGVSPDSSQLSYTDPGATQQLVTRTQKQHVTHNVTTTTKTIREVQYIGPDGQPLDFVPGAEMNGSQYALYPDQVKISHFHSISFIIY